MKKIVSIALLLLVGGSFALAQKGNIGFVYPCGACKGTTVEVTVGGQNLSKATGIIVSGQGVKGELIPMPKGQKPKKKKSRNIGEEDNLQLADQVRFRLTIDAKAEPGLRDLRLVMPNGVTNRLYFEVGQLPDVLEDGKADLSASSDQLPVTFNGQIMRSDVDRFRFRAHKGQKLVLEAKGRGFVPYMADAVPGWFQPVMHLYDAAGKEVAFSDDYTYHVDPVIFFEVPETGDYFIQIHDGLYRGREDFTYRISVGELPFITSVYPLGGPVGVRQKLTVRGWNLKSDKMKVSPMHEGDVRLIAKGKGGLQSNVALYRADKLEETDYRGAKPNRERDHAWGVPIDGAENGVITEPFQEHWYHFVSKKRQALHLEVVARRVGSPADLRMTVYDWKGKVVADNDDFEDADDYMATHFADPQITMRADQGRHYYVRLIETQAKSGPDYAFRFKLAVSQPDFSINLEPATFAVPEGGTGNFNVVLTRKQRFGGAVDLKVEGLPRGFKVSGDRIEPGARRTIVSVTAPRGAEHGTIHPGVVGMASVPGGGGDITREGKPVESMMQAFYYTHLMPIDEFSLEVGEPQPFRLEVEAPEGLKLSREQKSPVRVRVIRDEGFDKPVTLMLRSSESGVKAEAVVVEGNADSGVLEIVFTGKNPRDRVTRLLVSGVVKGSSGRIAGKARNAFVASITAYAPVFDAQMPGTGVMPKNNAKARK